MPDAFVLGRNGLIGHGLVPHFRAHGWHVTVGSRSGTLLPIIEELGVDAERVERSTPGALAAALGNGVDVLIDLIAFTEADADQINALAGRIGSAIAISSASVYVDASGRSLDEATSLEAFPQFPVPIPETHPLVSPSDASYSTQKVAMEQTLLAGPLDVTILRPGAIHGPSAALPRELFFTKRLIDGRSGVVLVDNGKSRFHTTSIANFADLARLAADRPATCVLNAGERCSSA